MSSDSKATEAIGTILGVILFWVILLLAGALALWLTVWVVAGYSLGFWVSVLIVTTFKIITLRPGRS